MRIIIIIILFSVIGFSQTKVTEIKKVRFENVLNKKSTSYIVRKVGENYVVDLVREYINKDGEIAFEVLATDRTFDGIKYTLTKEEKDLLDGKEQ